MGGWPWHWGTCFSVAAGGQAWWGAWSPACPLLHRSCASLVPKAARKETMETMEMGQEAPLAWPLSSPSEDCHTCKSPGASSCPQQHYPRAFIHHCDFLQRKWLVWEPSFKLLSGGSRHREACCPAGIQFRQVRQYHLSGHSGLHIHFLGYLHGHSRGNWDHLKALFQPGWFPASGLWLP